MKVGIRRRSSFSGGVHPPERKDRTRERPIEPGPAVREVSVIMRQHIGYECEPLVKDGDRVSKGQAIGKCKALLCAPVHSPVDGVVKEIALRSHAVLGRNEAVVIEADPDSAPRLLSFEAGADDTRYSPEQIREAVREAGIVGMGGAGFPTAVKIGPSPEFPRPKETLIVNACECEPYITCDYRIMLEWTRQTVAGIKLARKAGGCSQVLVGIEDNKPDAIEAMEAAINASGEGGKIKVAALKTKYPQGGERQLIKAILGKQVSTGGIPPMIGVVVLNVAAVAAIAEAVVMGRPLTHRVVTVTGDGIARPGNYYVAIGTTVQELIDFCGGLKEDAISVILGGPMMGVAIADLKTPVTKTTGAVVVLTREEVGEAKFTRRETPCIRCGRCLDVCPERLNPRNIAHAVKRGLLERAENYCISACIECGCCSYECPANIELVGYIETGKFAIARRKMVLEKS